MAQNTSPPPRKQTPPPEELARVAVQRLLDGQPPNGVTPEDCGPWGEPLQALEEAHETGGAEAVRKAWSVIEKQIPGLKELVAGPGNEDDPLAGVDTFTAAELLAMDLPEPDYIVEGVLPEGLSLLVAPPKIGKTFFALNVAVAVAAGGVALGKAPASLGRVLYIDLDGSKRGMQKRLRTMLNGDPVPKNLHIAREWERADVGGLRRLEGFLRAYPDTALIIIDVLNKFRPQGDSRRSMYELDYEALGPLRSLCEEHGASCIVVHHTNKRSDGDDLNVVSGSTGLTGAVENVLLLSKERGQVDAKLTVIPREEEEKTLALSFDGTLQTWILRGNFDDFAKTKERQQVLDLIRAQGRPMRAQEVCDALEGKDSAIRRLLRKMVGAGTLAQTEPRGPYALPQTSNNGNNGNKSHNGNIGNKEGLFPAQPPDVTDVTDVTGGRGNE